MYIAITLLNVHVCMAILTNVVHYYIIIYWRYHMVSVLLPGTDKSHPGQPSIWRLCLKVTGSGAETGCPTQIHHHRGRL